MIDISSASSGDYDIPVLTETQPPSGATSTEHAQAAIPPSEFTDDTGDEDNQSERSGEIEIPPISGGRVDKDNAPELMKNVQEAKLLQSALWGYTTEDNPVAFKSEGKKAYLEEIRGIADGIDTSDPATRMVQLSTQQAIRAFAEKFEKTRQYISSGISA